MLLYYAAIVFSNKSHTERSRLCTSLCIAIGIHTLTALVIAISSLAFGQKESSKNVAFKFRSNTGDRVLHLPGWYSVVIKSTMNKIIKVAGINLFLLGFSYILIRADSNGGDPLSIAFTFPFVLNALITLNTIAAIISFFRTKNDWARA